MASPDLVTVVPIGTSLGPHVSGPTGLTRTWCLWSQPGYHYDMVTLFTTSDPAGPINSGLHLDMVTLVPTWVSPEHGESDPHLVLTCNW